MVWATDNAQYTKNKQNVFSVTVTQLLRIQTLLILDKGSIQLTIYVIQCLCVSEFVPLPTKH